MDTALNSRCCGSAASHVRLFATARQASQFLTISWSLPKFMASALVMHSVISSSGTLVYFFPQFFPASGTFPIRAVCIRWPKYWSSSLSISPSNECSELISLKIDWLDLLAGQGTLRSLLQHHSSKPSILLHSAFFTVQLSQPYVTTGKTIILTIWTFVGRVMFLLFHTLSSFVIVFLPGSKCLLISWL